MSENTSTGAAATAAAARGFNRRTLLKSAAAIGAVAAAGPFVNRQALGANGTVRVYAWNDYISEEMKAEFEKDTGVTMDLSVYGTNNEVLNKLRASQGEGFDVVMPSVTTLVAWYDAGGLLQPIDESRIPVDNIKPAMWQKSLNLGATYRGERYALPWNWGTEGFAFNSEERDYAPGEVSYADLWSDPNKDLVTVRPRSALTAMVLLNDGAKMLDEAHQDEATAHEAFGRALDFAIEHKAWIRQFWKDTPTLQSAFLQNGCLVGQSWDGPALTMWDQTGGRIKYLAPKEGALTWLDTMCMTTGAQDIDAVYAFLDWMCSAKAGGMHARHSGYNSAMAGAEEYLDPSAKEKFNYAYNDGKAIEQLYWWKPEPQWFQQVRAQYIEKYEAA